MLVLKTMTHTDPPPFIIPNWSDGTDAEIAEALNRHYMGKIDLTKYWSCGDERVVHLSAIPATGVGEAHAETDITLVLSEKGGKLLADGETECCFQVDQKVGFTEKGYINSTTTNIGGWKDSARRTWCNNVYKDAFQETTLQLFKQFINQTGKGSASNEVENTIDLFALRSEVEIFGSATYSVSGEGEQIYHYTDSSNLAGKTNDWLRSPYKSNSDDFCFVFNGEPSYDQARYNKVIAPFGVI